VNSDWFLGGLREETVPSTCQRPDNVQQLAEQAQASDSQLEFILAVAARRYGELGGTLEGLTFTDSLPFLTACSHGPPATSHRAALVVQHYPTR
jgi:hypothetical protein